MTAGHVSPRSTRWVRESFDRFGWVVDEELTARARNQSDTWYLRKNTLILRRDEKEDEKEG